MCAPLVTRQMSRGYYHSCNSGSVFGSGGMSRTVFTSHHSQRHYQNCESASTPQSGTSHKTCLRGFGGNGSIAWTSAVSHEGHTLNAFKVTMKLQTFLFQIVVTSCILFSICENMVLQYPFIIYMQPVLFVPKKFIQNE